MKEIKWRSLSIRITGETHGKVYLCDEDKQVFHFDLYKDDFVFEYRDKAHCFFFSSIMICKFSLAAIIFNWLNLPDNITVNSNFLTRILLKWCPLDFFQIKKLSNLGVHGY